MKKSCAICAYKRPIVTGKKIIFTCKLDGKFINLEDVCSKFSDVFEDEKPKTKFFSLMGGFKKN